MRFRRVLVVGLAATLAALVAGCGSGGSKSSSDASSAGSGAATAAAPAAGLAGLLAVVPGGGSGLTAEYVDVHAIAAGATDPQAIVHALVQSDVPVPRLLQSLGRDPGDLGTELGIDLAQVTGVLEAGAPPDGVTAITGGVDPKTVDAAVRAFKPFAADVTSTEEHGFTVYRFGADASPDPTRITPLRPLGIGGRLAVRDGLALFSNTDAGIAAAVAAADGGTSALAGPGVEALAGALDGDAAAPALLAAVIAPASVASCSTGGAAARTGDVATIAVGCADGAAATAAATSLKTVLTTGQSQASGKRWSEIAVLDGVAANGSAAVATLHSALAHRLLQAPVVRDLVWAGAGS